MALASWTNSRIVGRFGLRRVGHGGALAFVAITAGSRLARRARPDEPLWLFVILQGADDGGFAFTSSNLGTLAMEHMAPIAGTASSVQGVIGTIGGAASASPSARRSTARNCRSSSALPLCGAVALGA